MKQKQYLFLLVLISFACNQQDQNDPSSKPITPQAVYSKEDAGNWQGKEEEHTPLIEVLSKNGENNIVVSVTLINPRPSHYIEKIFIADTKGKPYAEAVFKNSPVSNAMPNTDAPAEKENIGEIISSGSNKTYRARFSMPLDEQTKKEYAVYARCSQHDLWMAEFE
ncbi:MAG: hypothetical protein OEZ13_13500 [Spirochaetia bacterium]|nr:hypothetical protein [Spirochaetia bacterium]